MKKMTGLQDLDAAPEETILSTPATQIEKNKPNYIKINEVLATKSKSKPEVSAKYQKLQSTAKDLLADILNNPEGTAETHDIDKRTRIEHAYRQAEAAFSISDKLLDDKDTAISEIVDTAFEGAGLNEVHAIEKAAATNMLHTRVDHLDRQRQIYLKTAIASMKGESLAHDRIEEYVIFDEDIKKLQALGEQKKQKHEIAGTRALRNHLLQAGAKRKEIDFTNDTNLVHTQPNFDTIWQDMAQSKDLADITVTYTPEGIAMLRFAKQRDLMRFDQTIDQNGHVIADNAALWDDDGHLLATETHKGVRAAAYIKDGFIVLLEGADDNVAYHEYSHIQKEYLRQARIEAYKETTILKWAESIQDQYDDLTELSVDDMRPALRALIEGNDIDDNSVFSLPFWEELLGKETIKEFRIGYNEQIQTLAEVRAAEQLGTTLLTHMVSSEDEVLRLSSAGIENYDADDESHQATLVLIRHLNKLIAQEGDEGQTYNKARIAIGLNLLNMPTITLEQVHHIMQEHSLTDTGEDLDLSGLIINADGTYSVEDNFGPEDDENLPSFVREHGGVLYADNGHFIRQSIYQLYEGKDGGKISYFPIPLPFFQKHRPWTHKPLGIPGTGPDFATGARHLLPRRFMTLLGFDQTEFHRSGKILPFALGKHPRFKPVVKRLKKWAERTNPAGYRVPGHETEGWAEYAGGDGYAIKHISRIGVHDRIREQINSILSHSIQRLDITQLQAYYLLEKIGGIEVDLFRERPSFRLEDFNEVDDYRNNEELQYFVENIANHGRGGLATESTRIHQTESLNATDITTLQNETIYKGTTTDSLQQLMKRLVWATHPDLITKRRRHIETIGEAVMSADIVARRASPHGKYTIRDLIQEISRVDRKSPTAKGMYDITEDVFHHADNTFNVKNISQRKYIQIGDKAYDIEDAREFVTAFYLARTHLVLHSGIYNHDKYEVRNNSGTIEVMYDDVSNPQTGPYGQTFFLKQFIDISTIDSLKGYEAYFRGKLAAGDTDSFNLYDEGDIHLNDPMMQRGVSIGHIEHIDNLLDSQHYFGFQDASGNIDLDTGRESLSFTLEDNLGEIQRGVELYRRFMLRAHQIEHQRKYHDNAKNMWNTWIKIDKVARWSVMLVSVLALINPAYAALFSAKAVIATLIWTYTGSPMINKSYVTHLVKKKAAEAGKDFMQKARPLYESLQKEHHGTTDLNEADSYLLAVRGQCKAVAKADVDDFEWFKSNRMQTLISGVTSAMTS